MNAAPKLKLHTTGCQTIANGSRVRDRSGQPIKLWHDQSIATANSRKGLIKAGSLPVRASKAFVRVDAIGSDTEFEKFLLLDREVLFVRRASGIADQCVRHAGKCNV
ncbi:hypothetical protein AAJCM20276_37620 (plasmid) [Acetobacter aceti]|uniref:Uncharacterized protein n=1 Tax=Acetobacter aceti TaxID=435 RepID=A0A6S6PMT7_ACEAC|nr:hypothetical protein AAJCM20276_37620 [Acetobacter aceti]